MFQQVHFWRFRQHYSQGHLVMALEALHADPDSFSFTDALILTAWIAGARAEMIRRGLLDGTQPGTGSDRGD